MSRSTQPARRGPRTGVTVALSVVLVPAAALLAVALANPASPEEPQVESEAATTTTSIVAQTAPTVVIEPVSSTEADLVAACTVDGIALVEAEASGEISELQSAALDALRQLCAEAGLEMPGPPAPPPVVRTVTVAGPTDPPDGTASPGGGGDDDDDDEDDDEDEDEEDEEDDEDDEDDEDEDDEDDEDDDDDDD